MDKFGFDEAIQKWNELKMRGLFSYANNKLQDKNDIVFINIVR